MEGLIQEGAYFLNFTVSFDTQIFSSQGKYICGLFGERSVGILAAGQDQIKRNMKRFFKFTKFRCYLGQGTATRRVLLLVTREGKLELT